MLQRRVTVTPPSMEGILDIPTVLQKRVSLQAQLLEESDDITVVLQGQVSFERQPIDGLFEVQTLRLPFDILMITVVSSLALVNFFQHSQSHIVGSRHQCILRWWV